MQFRKFLNPDVIVSSEISLHNFVRWTIIPLESGSAANDADLFIFMYNPAVVQFLIPDINIGVFHDVRCRKAALVRAADEQNVVCTSPLITLPTLL